MGGCKQVVVHLSHSSQNIPEKVLKRAITGLDLSHHSQSLESFGGSLNPLGVSNQGSEWRVQGAISPTQEGIAHQDVPAQVPACCPMVNKPHHTPHSGRVHSPTPASSPAAAPLIPTSTSANCFSASVALSQIDPYFTSSSCPTLKTPSHWHPGSLLLYMVRILSLFAQQQHPNTPKMGTEKRKPNHCPSICL